MRDTKTSLLLLAVAALLAGFSLAACGDGAPGVGNQGAVVGGPCTPTNGCASGATCLTGGDYPGGTCSVPCSQDADCPGGTACIDTGGGRCLLMCAFTTDCRSGYECKGKKRVDKSGEALVCRE